MTTALAQSRAADADQADTSTTPAPDTSSDQRTAGGVLISELRARLAASPSGKIVIDVDPNEVVFGDNIRQTVEVKKRTINSVKEHGFVQEPPAFINDDDRIEMIAGQRRMLAAREAGVASVSIVLKAPPGEDANTLKRAKIEAQWTENEDREAMTAGDKLVTIENYLDLPGVTPTRAARKLPGIDAADVRAAKALRNSPRARQTAADGQLSITQAEALMEFEDDTAAEKRLFDAAARGTFTAEAAKIRAERKDRAARAEAAKPYAGRGFAILDRKPGSWDHGKTCTPLENLYLADGSAATVEHIRDNKHWAVYLEHSEVENPEGGMDDYFEPVYHCTDLKATGLTYSYSKPRTAPAVEKERKRDSNRIVKAGNKYARTATVNRRKYERDLLARLWGRDGKRPQKLPAGLFAWAVRLLFSDPAIINEQNALGVARDLLSGTRAKPDAAIDFDNMTDPHAAVTIIGLALGAVEARMERPNYLYPDRKTKPEYWRVLHPASGPTGALDMVKAPHAMLAQLRDTGHQPTPLEMALLGEMTLTAALEAEAAAENAAEGTLTATATTKPTPAKKAPAKPAPAKKAPAKKAPAKKAPAKKTATTEASTSPAPDIATVTPLPDTPATTDQAPAVDIAA